MKKAKNEYIWSIIAKVTTLYKKKKEKLHHAWYNEIEETVELQEDSELEIHDDSTSDDKELNGFVSDFKTDKDDKKVKSPEIKAKLSLQLQIYIIRHLTILKMLSEGWGIKFLWRRICW